MGVDYAAIAVIGLYVGEDKLYVEKTVRGCACKGIAKGVKFCPECGKKAWVKENVPIPQFDDEDWPRKLMDKYTVYDSGTDSEGGYIALEAVGTGSSRCGEYEAFKELEYTEEALAEFQKDMESLGLWDPDLFGLWAVSYCGY